MSAVDGDLPLLRFRDGDEDGWFGAPVSIIGKIVGLDEDVVTIDLGRRMTTQLYVEDFFELLDGPEATLGFFADAAANADLVAIELGRERLTYDNPKQLERMRAAAAATGSPATRNLSVATSGEARGS